MPNLSIPILSLRYPIGKSILENKDIKGVKERDKRLNKQGLLSCEPCFVLLVIFILQNVSVYGNFVISLQAELELKRYAGNKTQI